MKKLFAIAALMSLSACSIFESKGDEIIFDKTLGPATETQVANLPNNLKGDKDNARYSGEALKGEGMESRDGTD
ncbi:hypothetical protein [Kordiimonas aestuarii]|uniref:hypothetical protein n=1 Tax=Kordiimonas aestuarii TaxID=1005925 RepID=UPI0021D05536|nr:hypothetical protein [Kordiimonas aestuarii]